MPADPSSARNAIKAPTPANRDGGNRNNTKPGTFRVVNDAEGMGRAVLTYCKPDDPSFRRAAKSCLWLEHGDLEPEEVRADFVQALTSAGVFVRDP